jgi:hypothetical protein
MASAIIALVLSVLAHLHLSHAYTIDLTCYGGLYGEEVVQGIKDAMAEGLQMADMGRSFASLPIGDMWDNTREAMFPNLNNMHLELLRGTLQHKPALVTTNLAARFETAFNYAHWRYQDQSKLSEDPDPLRTDVLTIYCGGRNLIPFGTSTVNTVWRDTSTGYLFVQPDPSGPGHGGSE